MATKRKGRYLELKEAKILACKGWNTKNKQPVKALKLVQGRNIPYLTEREIDQAEVMKQYKEEDFMLENIIAIGAEGELKATQLQMSTLQTLDWLEEGAGRELDKMEAEEWAAKYLQQNQNKNENTEE